MTKKLYEKYQEPHARFIADWVFRVLVILGVGVLGYVQLWADTRWVSRTDFAPVIEALELVEPRLRTVELHVSNDQLHPTTTANDERYVTRREFMMIRDQLTRIENKIDR